jgi:hypothetical protein
VFPQRFKPDTFRVQIRNDADWANVFETTRRNIRNAICYSVVKSSCRALTCCTTWVMYEVKNERVVLAQCIVSILWVLIFWCGYVNCSVVYKGGQLSILLVGDGVKCLSRSIIRYLVGLERNTGGGRVGGGVTMWKPVYEIRPPLWSEFLATYPEAPGSISGATRFSEK